MKVNVLLDFVEQRIGVSGDPASLVDLLIAYYREEESLSELTAGERAEKEAPKLIQRLADRIAAVENGMTLPVLRIVDEVSGRVCGSCWVSDQASAEERIASSCVASVKEIIAAIHSLKPSDFEDFCAAFLSLLGATKTRVTPRSGDAGIDFYGWLKLGAFLPGDGGFSRLPDRVRFFFAGQAKHYPDTRLGPAVVRELVGAVSLARHGTTSSAQDLFEGMAFRPFDPLVVLLITTGGFTKGAKELAINSGIVPCDVGQIALYLAVRQVGFSITDSIAKFEPNLFMSWIFQRANYELTPPLDVPN
jgi:hypothetical protein